MKLQTILDQCERTVKSIYNKKISVGNAALLIGLVAGGCSLFSSLSDREPETRKLEGIVVREGMYEGSAGITADNPYDPPVYYMVVETKDGKREMYSFDDAYGMDQKYDVGSKIEMYNKKSFYDNESMFNMLVAAGAVTERKEAK